MITMPFLARFDADPLPCYTPGGHGFVTERERDAIPALRISEINSGFTPVWWYEGKTVTELARSGSGAAAVPSAAVRETDLFHRAIPLWYKADTGAGRFRVTAALRGVEDCDEVLLFVSRRRLCWRGTLRKGEQVTVTALCDVSPIIAVGGGDAAEGDHGRAEDTSVDVAVVGAALDSLKIQAWEGKTLYLMGDSTVTDQPAQVPYAPGATYAGWGQMLPVYLGEQYCVSNHAHSGLSTETFRDKGHYDVMYPLLRPGDMVLIQFGHNDQKRLHLAAGTGYSENLFRYIRELRAAGTCPVLVTPLARNTWASDADYNDMLAPFAAAMKRIGQAEDVPVLDLHAAMKTAICRAGMDAARVWFHPCDYTHTNDFGAHMAAGFVAEELARFGLISGLPVPAWRAHDPLDELKAPPDEELGGLTPPAGSKPLVDYGLIPDAPWPIT